MNATLIIALGNPLVPKDASAVAMVRHLRNVGVGNVDIIEGGTDLLRLAAHLRDRKLILLVDVCADLADRIVVLEHGSPQLADSQLHAHHLSAVQALNLIRWADENVRAARCVWVLLPSVLGAGITSRYPLDLFVHGPPGGPRAEVAEWQTHATQNRAGVTP